MMSETSRIELVEPETPDGGAALCDTFPVEANEV